MTTHLSPQEFVSALEGGLPAPRLAHLDGCAACQAQVEDLRGILDAARQDASVPEPSPLFWDHFPARVLNAVHVENQPASASWWAGWVPSRPFLAMGAASLMLVAGAAVYLSRPAAPVDLDVQIEGTDATGASVIAEGLDPIATDEWDFVAGVMGTLDADDAHEVLIPSRDAVDAAIESLNGAERETLMKLLKAQLGADLGQGME